MNRKTRSIVPVGGSRAVTIPKDWLHAHPDCKRVYALCGSEVILIIPEQQEARVEELVEQLIGAAAKKLFPLAPKSTPEEPTPEASEPEYDWADVQAHWGCPGCVYADPNALGKDRCCSYQGPVEENADGKCQQRKPLEGSSP